jgi:hypothetical protein
VKSNGRSMPERATASCTTGIRISTSLRSSRRLFGD